jgi:putative salt-induced outer membrane protein
MKITRHKLVWLVVVAFSLALSAVANAQEEAAKESRWSGLLSLGYLASEGNTESSSATAEFEVKYTLNKWEHLAKGRYFSSQSDDGAGGPVTTTAENYNLRWKSDYSFTENNYAFGVADWVKNRFSGYPRQVFLSAGYGRRFIKNDTLEFNGEIGAGYADQKAVNAAPPPETIDEDGALGTAALDFKWIWTDTSAFSQTLKANYTENNTFWESVTKVSAKISTSLALGISYTVLGNTDVAPGIDKTDRFTAITLDYSY